MCSLLHSCGRVDLKAKQYHLKFLQHLQHGSKKLDVNTDAVASVLEVCKTNSAELSFEHVLGLVSFRVGVGGGEIQKQPPDCALRKGVLRNIAKFIGKYLCQSLLFNKVAGLWSLFSIKL